MSLSRNTETYNIILKNITPTKNEENKKQTLKAPKIIRSKRQTKIHKKNNSPMTNYPPKMQHQLSKYVVTLVTVLTLTPLKTQSKFKSGQTFLQKITSPVH